MKNKGLIIFAIVSGVVATLLLLAWSTLFIRPDTRQGPVTAYTFPRDSAAIRRYRQSLKGGQGKIVLMYHTDTVTGKGYQVWDSTEVK